MQIRPYIVEYYEVHHGVCTEHRYRQEFAYDAADAAMQAKIALDYVDQLNIVKVSPDFTAAADNQDSTAQR